MTQQTAAFATVHCFTERKRGSSDEPCDICRPSPDMAKSILQTHPEPVRISLRNIQPCLMQIAFTHQGIMESERCMDGVQWMLNRLTTDKYGQVSPHFGQFRLVIAKDERCKTS